MFTKSGIFTTVVNMDDLVNTLSSLQKKIQASGVSIWLEGDRAYLAGPGGSSCLRIVRLYRPSSEDIKRAAAPDVLLVLTAATWKAAKAAAEYNHILVPGIGYRIVAPGIALIRDATLVQMEASRQVRLSGRTGVVAESLLLGGKKEWSVRELAASADVSPALAHRVVTRLEGEGLLTSYGQGARTTRGLSNFRALAELWSQEEKIPKPVLRGYLYGGSIETLARKVLEVCPDGAIGGTLAANLYRPVLTRVTPPIRIWVPDNFSLESLLAIGFQQTDEGANLALTQAKEDPWRVHRYFDGLPRVSKWRAWLEVANTEGRTQELAEALLSDLE